MQVGDDKKGAPSYNIVSYHFMKDWGQYSHYLVTLVMSQLSKMNYLVQITMITSVSSTKPLLFGKSHLVQNN